MGAVGSKVARMITNPLRNEMMMHREISKEKPKQAPRHPTTEEKFNTLIKENPVLQEIDKVKDTNYLKLLHDLKVDSFDQKVQDERSTKVPSKHQQRLVPGKVTYEQILELFSLKQNNPEEWSADRISKKYHLNEETVENMLVHFSSFNIVKNEKKESPLKKIDLI